jgi:hypothetical protein
MQYDVERERREEASWCDIHSKIAIPTLVNRQEWLRISLACSACDNIRPSFFSGDAAGSRSSSDFRSWPASIRAQANFNAFWAL